MLKCKSMLDSKICTELDFTPASFLDFKEQFLTTALLLGPRVRIGGESTEGRPENPLQCNPALWEAFGRQ
jgi:hypothetical protein